MYLVVNLAQEDVLSLAPACTSSLRPELSMLTRKSWGLPSRVGGYPPELEVTLQTWGLPSRVGGYPPELGVTLQETNISHLGKKKIIDSKVPVGRGYVIVPRRVDK